MQVQWLFSLLSVVTLAYVIDLIRRRHLQESYALLWLFLWSIGLFLSLFKTDVLQWLAELIGVYAPENAFFLLAIVCLTWLSLHLTVKASQYNEQVRALAQKVALLECELEQHKNIKS